jgi:hypothetical protein
MEDLTLASPMIVPGGLAMMAPRFAPVVAPTNEDLASSMVECALVFWR